ncbi:hypothetical protein GSU68_15450 [Rathayibacter sp. VKM Ac-2759]|uniref:MmyB family transcriptional regulator n=1 Tax=Rathayibacter sp. VKM Ac-2759 TaxID=2609252 RepID=UPI0013174842|nr:hypothetical protein [Rathayibacter sp. VKM Ac-2759]QHC67826.1 hypothetical protein GSU68_15450 [Rathayibacter sp. VKM Ac-2759]
MDHNGPDVPLDRDRARALLTPWAHQPAVVLDRHLEVLSATPLARALSPCLLEGVNIARFTFLDPRAQQDRACWREAAGQVTALLSDSLDRHDADRGFRSIVGELSARSPGFATAWAAGAPARGSGSVRFLDTAVGTVPLGYRLTRPPDDDEHTLLVFEPADAAARDALGRLAVTVREPRAPHSP